MGHGLSLYLSACVTHFCCQAEPGMCSGVTGVAKLLITWLEIMLLITYSFFADSITTASKTSALADAVFVTGTHRCVVEAVTLTTQIG